MGIKEKIFKLELKVNDTFCDMDIFLENVKSADGDFTVLKEKLKKAENDSDYDNIVNCYI